MKVDRKAENAARRDLVEIGLTALLAAVVAVVVCAGTGDWLANLWLGAGAALVTTPVTGFSARLITRLMVPRVGSA